MVLDPILFHPTLIGFTKNHELDWYMFDVFWICGYRKTKETIDVTWQLSVGTTILLEFSSETSLSAFFMVIDATKPVIRMLDIINVESAERLISNIELYHRKFKIDQLCTPN